MTSDPEEWLLQSNGPLSGVTAKCRIELPPPAPLVHCFFA